MRRIKKAQHDSGSAEGQNAVAVRNKETENKFHVLSLRQLEKVHVDEDVPLTGLRHVGVNGGPFVPLEAYWGIAEELLNKSKSNSMGIKQLKSEACKLGHMNSELLNYLLPSNLPSPMTPDTIPPLREEDSFDKEAVDTFIEYLFRSQQPPNAMVPRQAVAPAAMPNELFHGVGLQAGAMMLPVQYTNGDLTNNHVTNVTNNYGDGGESMKQATQGIRSQLHNMAGQLSEIRSDQRHILAATTAKKAPPHSTPSKKGSPEPLEKRLFGNGATVDSPPRVNIASHASETILQEEASKKVWDRWLCPLFEAEKLGTITENKQKDSLQKLRHCIEDVDFKFPNVCLHLRNETYQAFVNESLVPGPCKYHNTVLCTQEGSDSNPSSFFYVSQSDIREWPSEKDYDEWNDRFGGFSSNTDAFGLNTCYFVEVCLGFDEDGSTITVTFEVAAKGAKGGADALDCFFTHLVTALMNEISVLEVAISGNQHEEALGLRSFQLGSDILHDLLSVENLTVRFHKWTVGDELQNACTRAKAKIVLEDCELQGDGRYLFGFLETSCFTNAFEVPLDWTFRNQKGLVSLQHLITSVEKGRFCELRLTLGGEISTLEHLKQLKTLYDLCCQRTEVELIIDAPQGGELGMTASKIDFGTGENQIQSLSNDEVLEYLQTGDLPEPKGDGGGKEKSSNRPRTAVGAVSTWGPNVFKQQEQVGSWKCKVCLVSNSHGARKCVACETTRPGFENEEACSSKTDDAAGDGAAKTPASFIGPNGFVFGGSGDDGKSATGTVSTGSEGKIFGLGAKATLDGDAPMGGGFTFGAPAAASKKVDGDGNSRKMGVFTFGALAASLPSETTHQGKCKTCWRPIGCVHCSSDSSTFCSIFLLQAQQIRLPSMVATAATKAFSTLWTLALSVRPAMI